MKLLPLGRSSSLDYLTSARIVHGYACGHKKLHKDYEDDISVILGHDNGMTSVLNASYLSPFKNRTISIFGEKGAIVSDYLAHSLKFIKNPSFVNDKFDCMSEGDIIDVDVIQSEPLYSEIKHFLDKIRNHDYSNDSVDDASYALYIAEKLQKSYEQGKVQLM